jgi:hypothetical protein
MARMPGFLTTGDRRTLVRECLVWSTPAGLALVVLAALGQVGSAWCWAG